MSAYIQDNNNAESIANDSTVLNATNYGNLTYKVDELQFVLNELHKYKHTTIISSIKDSWASESWDTGDGGTKSNDTSNYILNGKSVKMTGDAQWDGIHVEKSLDLTTHADGYTAGADDLITFFAYITSQDLTDLGSARLAIGFYNDVLGTVTNYYWARFDDQLKAGKNIIKLKKSDFTSQGAPDWSTLRGIDIYLYNAAPDAETNVSIDMLLLHGQEYKDFVVKTSNESVSNDSTVNNDSELYVAIPQNGIFEIQVHIACSGGSTPDIKFVWTVSGDLSFLYNRFVHTIPRAVGDILDTNVKQQFVAYNSEVSCGVDGTNETIHTENFIVTTANDGGTLQLQWSQVNSSATAVTVKAGSYIRVIRLQ